MQAQYLQDMVQRLPPVSQIVHGSTPVISFGDCTSAKIATLGINPSASEFQDKNKRLFDGDDRRLSTLVSLGAESTASLNKTQVKTVIDDCFSYFHRRPFEPWFKPLNAVIKSSLGLCYYTGDACHLDLVQWATDPIWGRLRDRHAQKVLMEETAPHLNRQIENGRFEFVLLNGNAVIQQLTRCGLVRLEEIDERIAVSSISCRLYVGSKNRTRFLGWSTNLQSSWGVPSEFSPALCRWIAKAA